MKLTTDKFLMVNAAQTCRKYWKLCMSRILEALGREKPENVGVAGFGQQPIITGLLVVAAAQKNRRL
jgi:hypothetical protein